MRRSALLLLALAMCAAGQKPAPVRVLVITGQSDVQYHDWRVSTPFLVDLLNKTGRFDVRVTAEPRGLNASALADYDTILLNYNGPRWGSAAEAAVESFVKSGKGFVSLHGVTYGPLMGTILKPGGGWSKAPGWPAYPELVGATWDSANIGHAPRHAFRVKVQKDHPVTQGMDAEFTVNDELYHRMSHRSGTTVLASAFDDPKHKGATGKDEPIAWAGSFGKGRTFHCTLGHDTSALFEPSAMALLARAVEWSGTGAVTLPAKIEPDHRDKDALRVLVVTGGHAYDTSFYSVFSNDHGYRWTHAVSQKDAFRPGMKDKWDVIVLYDMANVLGEAEAKNLREYVEAGKGVVAMHHSIVDYTSWPWWHEEVIGGKYFEKPVGEHAASKYKDDVPMVLRPAKGQERHPIVRGLGELSTVDECYKGMWHSPKITVLMETDADCNDGPAVYLGPNVDRYRAVYVQLGHGTYTHLHPGYRKLVHNAILWAGRRTDGK